MRIVSLPSATEIVYALGLGNELVGVSHERDFRLSAVRNARVYATDEHNYFSRSGPRLFNGIKILAQLIHPELFNEALDPQLANHVEALAEEL